MTDHQFHFLHLVARGILVPFFSFLFLFFFPAYSLVSWRRCLHLGSSSAWTGASRTSVNAWSVPLSSCASCALPSCPPACSTSRRSILMTRPPARSPSSLKSSRTSPTLPSRWCQGNWNLWHAWFLVVLTGSWFSGKLKPALGKEESSHLTVSTRDTSDKFSFLHRLELCWILCRGHSTKPKRVMH